MVKIKEKKRKKRSEERRKNEFKNDWPIKVDLFF